MNVKKSMIIVPYVNNILIIDLSKIDIQRIKKALNCYERTPHPLITPIYVSIPLLTHYLF